MDITRFAIEKNRVTIAALFILLFAGVSSYFGLSRAEDPGFTIRIALVTTYFPGASPERVANLVTDPIEEVIQEIPELDFVASESRTGVSVVFVNVDEAYMDMRPIWDDLRRKMQDIGPRLPSGVIGPMVDDQFGDVFGTVISIEGEGFTYAELEDYAEAAKDELLLLDDVSQVRIYGTQEERIFVEFNNARLAEIGLSPRQLGGILQSLNIVMPGGDVVIGPERISLEPTGAFSSVEDVRNAVVSIPGTGETVFLRDITEVWRGYIDPPDSLFRVDGRGALALAISMRDGGNITELGAQIRGTIQRIHAEFPIGIEFDEIAFQADEVENKVQDFGMNLVQAVAIVLVVMLIFLGLRTGLVVASLVPSAMIMALFFMGILDIGLDQMSLAALIIALGLLVDNAIVMAESIMVSMSEGKDRIEAAVSSARELRVPLLVSSLTTAAAFLPIYLAESGTGEYTAPLFKVVTITLLCSWTLALTMIPLFCVLFIKVKKKTKAAYSSGFYRLYRAVILFGLRHKLLSLLLVVGMFAMAIAGMRFVPAVFFPSSDKAIFTAELELQSGASIEMTAAMMADIEQFMTDELLAERAFEGTLYRAEDMPEGLINWGTWIGAGLPRFYLSANVEPQKSEYAIILGNASSREAFDEALTRLDAFIREAYPGVSATVAPLQLGPPVVAPIQVRLSGADWEQLFRYVDRVTNHLHSLDAITNVENDWGTWTKTLEVQIDQVRAQRVGVSSEDIAVSLQTYLTGVDVTEFREADNTFPVMLRSAAEDRHDIDRLHTMNVYSQATGQTVPLLQVADIELKWEPGKIMRRNRLPTVEISAWIQPGLSAIGLTQELAPWLEEESVDWPFGYNWELGGEFESSAEANASISAKLPIAGLIIIFLLISQFNSFRKPAIILLTIPLSLIGVVFGLIVARSVFGFMTFLGVISLAGIVINNAIVLIDRIKIEMDDNGLSPPQAVIEASQRRLRPIFLTTTTTVGGMLPLWFGGGPMFQPMAIAIIFGLIFATALTLGVVPLFYSLFFRVKFKGFEYEPKKQTAVSGGD